nr:(2Fe-2S)-binding protein [Lolliginicoccus lacisalsi]
MTASAYVLGWYGRVPGIIGGLSLALDHRVPRLAASELAFGCDPLEAYPDRYALLDSRFWCLPDDPDASHPDASVVANDSALAAILRAQVRAHADAFLASYRGGARLPRRTLQGVFFDGIDIGIWLHDRSPGAEHATIEAAREVLPGGTAEFRDSTTLYLLDDALGRTHLTRERISCCYYYKIAEQERACLTCPRTSIDERVQRLAEIEA